MNYFFNTSVCLFLLILQTTVMPYIQWLSSFYDLLIPFIVYLGLARNIRESLPFVFFAGFIMDNLSGSPFGLYLTIYFWLFVGVKGITSLIQVGNRLLILTLIVAAGIVFENLIFIGTLTVIGPESQPAADAARIVAVQLLWAIWSGPVLMIIFRSMQSRLDAGFQAIYARKGD